MTLTELRGLVSANVGLSVAVADELARIDLYLNEGVIQTLLDTGCTKTKGSMTTTADTGDYTLDTDIMAITDLDITSVADSQRRRLDRVTANEIDQLRAAVGTGVARVYAIDGNLLMLHPTPSGADTINFRYVRRPTAMTTGSDTPATAALGGIPLEHHQAIEFYASGRAAESDDKENTGLGKYWNERYLTEVVKIRRRVTERGGSRLAPSRLGGRSTHKTSPSQDGGW